MYYTLSIAISHDIISYRTELSISYNEHIVNFITESFLNLTDSYTFIMLIMLITGLN